MRKGNWRGKHTRQVSREAMKVYGAEFKKLRESANLTTSEMAKELGVFRTTIVRWERGETIPQRNIRYILKDMRTIVERRKNLDKK